MRITNDLIQFISTKSKIRKEELSKDTEVYESGIVSSLTMLELMSYIENKYSIIISPEELTEDNFSKVQTIAAFIEKKLEKDLASVA